MCMIFFYFFSKECCLLSGQIEKRVVTKNIVQRAKILRNRTGDNHQSSVDRLQNGEPHSRHSHHKYWKKILYLFKL